LAAAIARSLPGPAGNPAHVTRNADEDPVDVVRRLHATARQAAAPPASVPAAARSLLETSGSTGDPKGVLLSHANLLANVRAVGEALCAQEVEALASAVPGARPSRVAALGIADAATGTERLVVIAETRQQDPARREMLQRAVRDAIVSGIGSPPDEVLISDACTVLKTSSGKIRRNAMREAYLKDTLSAQPPEAWRRARLIAADLHARAGAVAGWLGRAIFTGWILLVLAATLPVLWNALAVRAPGRLAARAARGWARLALGVCGLRPRVAGAEHLLALGSAVLIANHASYLDPVVLMAAIPVPFHFVAKRALTGYPLIGTVIRKAGHVTIEKTGLSFIAGASGESALPVENI